MAKKSLDYNHALNQDYAQTIMKDLLDTWAFCRSEREAREDVWQESYRAWSVDRTESDKQYDGRSNLYMPQLRKETETMTRRLFKGLFSEDFLKAVPNRLEDEDLTMTNTQVVRHYIENVMDMKSFAMPWIKQGVLYGTSPARTFWRKDTNMQFLKERYFVENKEGILEPRTKVVHREVDTYCAPDIRAEDLFQTWVWPHNVDKPENIKIVFWRTKVQRSDLMKKAAAGTAINIDQIKDEGKSQDWDFRRSSERLQQFGSSGLYDAIDGDNYFNLLEVWCDLTLPGEKLPVPCVVEIVDEAHVIRIQRNPYWHQKPPFNFMRYIIPPPGEFYGRGLPESSMSLQHQANDLLNQGMDSATLSLNNITVINPAYAPNADSFEIEPAAIWWADPAAIKQFTFPDLSESSIRNVSMIRSIITEMSDNSPQLPDPIAGKARSTGQAQMAINEWQTDVFVFLDLITAEAMNPIAQNIHILLQQNLKDDDVIRVAGKYSGNWIEKVITPEMVVGNYNFKWIGALQIENQAVKTQQMMNLIKVFGSLPPQAQSEFKVKWDNFMVKLLRDGLLIKDVENIIETEAVTATVPPHIEHKIMDLKGELKVQDKDDDEFHVEQHTLYINKFRGRKDLSKSDVTYLAARMGEHLMKHQEQIERKTLEIQQAQMMMQMQMQMSGKGPEQQNSGPGNPSEIGETADQSDMERGQKVETT